MILVTGGSGFIGSHLVKRLLLKGEKVINIDNFNDYYELSIKIANTLESTGNLQCTIGNLQLEKRERLKELKRSVDSDNYTLEVVDLRELENLDRIFSVNEIDTVIHLAARAGVRSSIEDPILYQEVNGRGTQNILECCKKHRVKNFIGASSSSVYGNNKAVSFKETDIVDFAISPYAATKKANEVIGHVYHSLYKINTVFLRFFTVYGPGQRPDLAINKFTRMISAEEEIPVYGDGTSSRDYTYIEDIVEGIVKSLKFVMGNKDVYEIFNIGSSNPVSLNKMIETIENALGKKAIIKRFSMQPGDVNKTYADISKIKKMIDYTPKVTFEDGIIKFIRWFKDREKSYENKY